MWWETVADRKARPEALTQQGLRDPRITIGEISEKGLGGGDAADYVAIRATLTQINFSADRPPWYKACPNLRARDAKDGSRVNDAKGKESECAKKVTQTDDGLYLCTECGKIPNYTNRFMLSCQAADETGAVWMTAFDSVAKELLGGKSADELAAMIDEQKHNDVINVFRLALFQTWILRCRIKAELRDGRPTTSVHITAAKPPDWLQETNILKASN